MPQEPLDVCDIDPWIDPNPNSPNSNSYLYNAMIHPLVRVSIKGVLWYQGIVSVQNQSGWIKTNAFMRSLYYIFR
jgi:hypothetical protein